VSVQDAGTVTVAVKRSPRPGRGADHRGVSVTRHTTRRGVLVYTDRRPSIETLIERARARSQGAGVPESWGRLIQLEPDGDPFVGRHRGVDSAEGFNSGVYLLWDEAGELCFIWSCYRLNREYEREQPAAGADVVIVRAANYRTKYDVAGEATGLNYTVESEPNSAPLPDEPARDGDALPF
jgi:hypothetical protein